MSLEVAAKYLAAHGRGPDDQLVHMSGKEVAGLESIAKAMGGSLTKNPHTGLTEAGFLDDVAPLVIGAGLAAATGGMSLGADLAGSEMLSGLGGEILGGIGGLSNAAVIGGGLGLAGTLLSGGNLAQGLRYGLGGYGGATAATAGMNYMNQPTPAPTALDTATATPGGAQAVNTQVAGAPVTGTPTVQPAVVTPQGAPIYNTNIPAEGAVAPVAAPSNLSAAQASKLIADEQAASGSYFDKALGLVSEYPKTAAALALTPFLLKKPEHISGTTNPQMIRPFTYAPNAQVPTNMVGTKYVPGQDTSERVWYQPQYTALPPYNAASGGIVGLAGGGNPVEKMSNENAIGANTGFPQAYMHSNAYATPYQTPVSQNVLTGPGDVGVDPYTGEQKMAGGGVTGSGGLDLHIPLDLGGAGGGAGFGGNGVYGYQAAGSGGNQSAFNGQNNTAGAGLSSLMPSTTSQRIDPSPTYQQFSQGFAPAAPDGIAYETPIPGTPAYAINTMTQGPALTQAMNGFAGGGMAGGGYNLGGYSDGGRLLKGPGDGVSDSIPAQIGDKQPARLADGEFVVPARIVSELGNGSTEAGARQLYKMMDRVQQARGKTTGKEKVAKNTNAAKYLPA
jgi:hypothetical protein